MYETIEYIKKQHTPKQTKRHPRCSREAVDQELCLQAQMP